MQCADLRLLHRYGESVESVLKVSLNEAFARAVFHGTTGAVGNAMIVAVLWYGGKLVQTGELSAGALASFLMYRCGVRVCGWSGAASLIVD
jgi:ABC-type bacteriocin/lantibiotic exporter with double-glycine peptidase domain